MAAKTRSPAAFAVLAACAAAAPAAGETGDGGDGATALPPISVTATRNPVEAFEYPGMVTVLGPREIRARQASTADDLIGAMPNVVFSGGPRRTAEAPAIRGFEGPDVIVLFDGARQNFGSTHDGRFFIDPSLLKRVEVLRGPASSLYGSGGAGGVIEFRTIEAADFLDPGERAGASVTAGGRTANGERVAALTAWGAPADGVDLVVSVTRRASGPIKLGDGSTLRDTDDDIAAGLAKLGFAAGGGHRIEGAFTRFGNDAREPNNGEGEGGLGVVDKDVRADTWRAAWRYDDPDDRLFDLDAVVYRSAFRLDETRRDDAGTGPAGEVLKRDVTTTGLRVDNRSRAAFSDDAGAVFTYGGEFYRDVQNGAAGAGERDGVPDAESEFLGVFAQAELRFSEPFGVLPGKALVIPGIRYDRYESSSAIAAANAERQLSPRLGVSWSPAGWAMVFANYAHAFRAPTFNELYLDGLHFAIPLAPCDEQGCLPRGLLLNRFVANPALKPQRTRTFEFGGGLTFDGVAAAHDRLDVKASRFRVRGEDLIDRVVSQPAPRPGPGGCWPYELGQRGPAFVPGRCDGTATSINLRDAVLKGVEVEAAYESPRFSAALGWSTIDGEDRETGRKLGVLKPDTLALRLGVKMPEFDSAAGWRTVAARKFDKANAPEDERAAYTVHDVYFAWAPTGGALEGLRVDLAVDNLFDKAYSRVWTGALETGRDVKVSVGYAVAW